ncbi:MAG TPA: GGDEF domain-containing protein [Burkholderiales bacterium]|nr:GGDEF domain-containing protein [Burkholderiales bacterium]
MPPSRPHAQRSTLPSIEQEELRGISRTVAEIEWLLVIVVLLYRVFGDTSSFVEPALSMSMFIYAAFVMSFRYTNFYRSETRWKIAVETLAMVVFITWALWFTGGMRSPLLNAYLLVVITSALTLGKTLTLAHVGLIGACYLFLDWQLGAAKEMLHLAYLGGFLARLAPVLLVAYITTMFSADIRFGLNRAKLLSETDELTGLYNMRGFVVIANRLFAQAQRYHRSSSFLMVDSDNLKQVNDRLGHEAGNRLLQHVVKQVLGQLRSTDIAARYGGDEFVVMLPDTPARGAFEVAERIRNAIESTPFPAGTETVHCSVSIGAASYPQDGRSLDALLARADRALYQAKEAGRNRVAQFRGTPPEGAGPGASDEQIRNPT